VASKSLNDHGAFELVVYPAFVDSPIVLTLNKVNAMQKIIIIISVVNEYIIYI